MLLRTKKKLTFFCIGVFFLLGAVEYAVILPTANLYLTREFHSRPYMLGFLLSAFCLSGLIVAPIFGRISDRTGHTKLILMFSILWEIAGSLMYILKISDWFLVVSRLVAGVGTGVGSALYADIARITTTEERTATMSTFMAVRQLGLVIGPGFNFFLRHANFSIGELHINKYTAPGAFMAVMWLLFEVIVLFCFWDLPKLQRKAREDLIKREVDYCYRQRSNRYDSMMPATVGGTQNATNLNQTQSDANITPGADVSPWARGQETDWQNSSTVITPENKLLHIDNLTSSNEIMETAERLMTSSYENSGSRQLSREYPHGSLYDLGTYDADHFALDGEDDIPIVFDQDGQVRAPTGSSTPYNNFSQYVSYGAILRAPSQDDPPKTVTTKTSVSRPWRFYYDEYCREEVIVLLATVFIALFDQLALETMLTPLTDTLLNWGELENSILYIAAGVYVVLVFVIIRCASRCIHDRTLLLFGFLLATVVNVFLLWYLPGAHVYDKNDKYRNLPYLTVGVFVNLTGLPFLMVASVSLYSKITREETQGFSQGLRRMSGGLGNLLGPLWVGALIHKPTIMVGVMLALMLMGLGMLCLSFRNLSENYANSWKRKFSINSDRIRRQGTGEREHLIQNSD